MTTPTTTSPAAQSAHPGAQARISQMTETRIPPEARILGLAAHQLYPAGDGLSPSYFKREAMRESLLDRTTEVASIGSCFAREIKNWLLANHYTYLQTSDSPHARHGSAAWDRVFNTFSLRQEFERVFDRFNPIEKWWKHPHGHLLDPFRKGVEWADEADRARELAEHERDARSALTQCEILIITIGLNELWYDLRDGSVFYQVPPPRVVDRAKHAFRTAALEENIANLRRCQELLEANNPKCTTIITVSPVPLRATFCDEHNCVVSNAESKATLLLAAKQFAREFERVRYFPSYELVTTAIRDAFEPDNRHVKPEAVAQIMDVFADRYGASGA